MKRSGAHSLPAPLTRPLRAQLSRGGPLAEHFLDDHTLLEALAGFVAGEVRRGRRTRSGVALLVLAAPAVGALGGPFFLIAYLGAVAGVIMEISLAAPAPRRVHDRSVRYLRTDLLARTRAEDVPCLLALSDTLRRTPAVAHNTDYQLLTQVHARLAYLLPRFQSDVPLARQERRALRHLALQYDRARPELAVAALLLLADTGDTSLRRNARRWSARHDDGRVQAAAAEYLRATEKAP